MRKVLQLCHSYGPPFDDVARQWRVLLDVPGSEVITVFLTGAPDDSVSRLVGGTVLFLGYRSRDLKGLKRKPIGDVARLHAANHFDLVVAHRYKSIFIASHLADVPIIGVAHAYGVLKGWLRQWFVSRHRERMLLIGVSDAIRDDLREALKRWPVERIQTLHNRADTATIRQGQLNRAEARAFLKLPEDGFIVGNVGRLHHDKDQKTLIAGFARAVPELDNPHLVIIGKGELAPVLRSQAEAAGIADRVHFAGWVPEAWRYFKAFDIFALTSHYEPFGMVLLEAMIAGIPVISTNVGGAPEVLGDYGEYIDLGDDKALGRAMVAMQRADKTVQGLARVEGVFSDEAIREKLHSYLSELGI